MGTITKKQICAQYGIPTYETSVHYDNAFKCLRIYYHDTAIATIYDDGRVKIDSGGWFTPTTKKRINKILQALGLPYFIRQVQWEWYLEDTSGITYPVVFGKPNWNGATPGIWFDTNTKALVLWGIENVEVADETPDN